MEMLPDVFLRLIHACLFFMNKKTWKQWDEMFIELLIIYTRSEAGEQISADGGGSERGLTPVQRGATQ